jgi:hypothetical protein
MDRLGTAFAGLLSGGSSSGLSPGQEEHLAALHQVPRTEAPRAFSSSPTSVIFLEDELPSFSSLLSGKGLFHPTIRAACGWGVWSGWGRYAGPGQDAASGFSHLLAAGPPGPFASPQTN